MRTRLPVIFLVLTSFGLAPIAALAAECQPPTLTQEQLDYLAAQQVQLQVPDGLPCKLTRRLPVKSAASGLRSRFLPGRPDLW